MKKLENVYVKTNAYGRSASVKVEGVYYNVNLVEGTLPVQDGIYTLSADKIWFSEKNEQYSAKYFAKGNIVFTYSPRSVIM